MIRNPPGTNTAYVRPNPRKPKGPLPVSRIDYFLSKRVRAMLRGYYKASFIEQREISGYMLLEEAQVACVGTYCNVITPIVPGLHNTFHTHPPFMDKGHFTYTSDHNPPSGADFMGVIDALCAERISHVVTGLGVWTLRAKKTVVNINEIKALCYYWDCLCKQFLDYHYYSPFHTDEQGKEIYDQNWELAWDAVGAYMDDVVQINPDAIRGFAGTEMWRQHIGCLNRFKGQSFMEYQYTGWDADLRERKSDQGFDEQQLAKLTLAACNYALDLVQTVNCSVRFLVPRTQHYSLLVKIQCHATDSTGVQLLLNFGKPPKPFRRRIKEAPETICA